MITIVKHRGVTLLELIISLALLGIILAIAIPDFKSTIQNNTIATVSNDFISSINLARSEAIKRGVPVSICATADQNFTSCGSSWSLGWIVFVNPTSGNVLSNTATAPTLRVQEITNSSVTMSASPALNLVTYSSSGFTAAGTGNVTFTIKATGCTIDSGRSIAISVTGRPVVSSVNCP